MNRTRRWSRTGLLLALACLALATTAGAADRMADPAAAPATVEGIVWAVIPPAEGQGFAAAAVKLADGLISIDASSTRVTLVTGQPGTVGDIKPGMRIVAVLKPGPPPSAQQILVTGAAGLVDVQGAVDAVDATARTFSAAGIKFQVTAGTSFGGPRDGSGTTSLADLRVGDPVRVSAGNQGGVLTAARVLVLGKVILPGERLHGIVKAIGTESWTLSVDGKERMLLVNAQTKVVGEPKVGDEVDALAQLDGAGNLVALLIVKSGATPPPSADVVTFDGTVKAIAAASWTITGRDGDVVVAITPTTKIEGSPAVGDAVKVAAQRATGGALTALVIVKLPVTPPVPDTSFEATVKSIGPASWVVVDGKGTAITLAIASTTRIAGDPKVGDRVRVMARQEATGLVAIAIMKVPGGPNPGPSSAVLEGVVTSIDATGTIWVVANVKVLVAPTTRIDTGIKVGDTVVVSGVKNSDGSVTATQIRKK